MAKFGLRVMVLGLMCFGLTVSSGAASLGGKFGIFGNLGLSTFAMDDFNKDIDDINTLMTSFGVSGKAEKIIGGLTAGGGLQYGVLDNLLIGAEVEGLMAGSKTDFTALGQKVTFELSMPATAVGAFIKGVLPAGNKFFFTGGIGVDYISLAGAIKVTHSDDVTFTGSGMGFRILVGGQVLFTEMFGLGLDLGYRIAKITELKDKDGKIFKKSDNTNESADYSGLITRLGVNLYF